MTPAVLIRAPPAPAPLETAIEEAARAAGARRTGLAVCFATSAMLLAGFSAAYVVRRTSPDWTPLALPGVLRLSTAVLIASSLVLEGARRRRSRAWALAAAALGLAFLAGQAGAWRALAAAGLAAPAHPHAAFFLTLTAVHGLHLVAGLAALGWAASRPAVLGPAAAWWHFTGAAWLYIYALLALG